MHDLSLFSLLSLGFTLGLRHGIDWDHIAAITDITGSVVTIDEPKVALASSWNHAHTTEPRSGLLPIDKSAIRRKVRREFREGFFLATMYAWGHALLVVILGLTALWVGAILPDWLDPIMERWVGGTLILLGGWILYSIYRDGRSFQPQSRWMLIFSAIGRIWKTLKSKITKQPIEHSHSLQYGARTAFGVGLIHGIGAETGSQAVLLAAAAGVTTKFHASLLLVTFTIGLLLSNSLVAAFSLTGFVSAGTRRTVYVGLGILASLFSLLVGIYFVTGQGASLPDLQELLDRLLGKTMMMR
jgi:high-affinity nickel permease